jgi:K(+)-stimulated pyrophosphate-energized sodium pump
MASREPAVALRFGTIGAPASSSWSPTSWSPGSGSANQHLVAVIAGSIGGIVIGLVTEYYTSGKPGRAHRQVRRNGRRHGDDHRSRVGMQSVAIPVLAIAAIIFVSTELAGLYGVGIAASACSPPSASPWPSTPTVRWPTTPAASPRWAAWARKPAQDHRLARRARQHHGRDRQGLRHRRRGAGSAGDHRRLRGDVSHNVPDFSLHLGDPDVLIGLFIGGLIPFLIAPSP